ncbi:MAG: tyrosine-type recombinase/integrase [Sphingomonadaceae bacterium]
MAIRKRQWTASDGTPKQAWVVDYRDQAGKRRHKQFARKKDAEAWSTSARWQVSQGVHTPDSQSVTVAEAARLWIKRAETEDLERATIERYQSLVRLHIEPLLGGEKLSRLTRPKVEAFRDTLLESRSRSLATKAIRGLSMILGDSQRRGLVAQNVARDVKVDKGDRERERVEIPTKAELRALLEHASDDFRPFITLAIFSGLRASELRGLRWQDVDLKGGTVTVAQRADKYCEIGPPKSRAGRRTVPLPPKVVTELKAWKLRCPVGELGLAFPNKVGGVQDYGHLLRRRFYPLQVEAGIVDREGEAVKPRYGLHALRHAAASAWIAQGIDLKRLQVWLGHTSIELTLDVYGHLIVDPAKDAELMARAQAELLS